MKTKKYKVVRNACFGGFSISKEAVLLGRKLFPNNKMWWDEKYGNVLDGEKYEDGTVAAIHSFDSYGRDIPRHHPELIEVIETLKEKANGRFADLKIETLNGTQYLIQEYDGLESLDQPSDSISWINAVEFPIYEE